MSYAIHFGSDGIKPVETMGKPKKPVIVGDLLALWQFEDSQHPRYLIDGMEGGMTPVGTFEKDVGAVTYRDGVLLVATREYVDAHMCGDDVDELPEQAFSVIGRAASRCTLDGTGCDCNERECQND